MRIAIAQLNYTVGDLDGNVGRILEAAKLARRAKCRLLVTSELAICGYPPLDLLTEHGFARRCKNALGKLMRECATMKLAVLVGFPEERRAELGGKRLHNAAALLDGGKLCGVWRKRLLPTYDIFDEARYFEPGSDPIRPLMLDGVALGVLICEDSWNDASFWKPHDRLYDEDPAAELVNAGARVLINLSASPWCPHRRKLRSELFAHACKRHGRVGVLVNQVGGNDDLIFDGSSMFASPAGKVSESLGPPSFVEEVAAAEIDVERGSIDSFERLRAGTLQAEVVDKEMRKATRSFMRSSMARRLSGGLEDVLRFQACGELRDALVLGLKDYVRKCGFERVLVSLSGGVDSALVAVLARYALGADAVRCVGLPSAFSSQGSVDDARELCAALDIPFATIAIDTLQDKSLALLGPHVKAPSDQRKDTALALMQENIQPRLRGMLMMALANQGGALLLACGNKSELAVGYATLYGDMCGGLAPIGDVYKTTVYELCRYINTSVHRDLIPQAILDKPPSAELRPDQRDTDSLPPYEVLDPILRMAIDEARSQQEIVAAGHDGPTVKRVLGMIARSEFKRRQAPPVLRVSMRAFGRGRVMPIAQAYKG